MISAGFGHVLANNGTFNLMLYSTRTLQKEDEHIVLGFGRNSNVSRGEIFLTFQVGFEDHQQNDLFFSNGSGSPAVCFFIKN